MLLRFENILDGRNSSLDYRKRWPKKKEIELNRKIANKSRYYVFQSYIFLWQNFVRVSFLLRTGNRLTFCCAHYNIVRKNNVLNWIVFNSYFFSSILGFQTHTTPVLLAQGERAELATEEYLPLTPIMEGFVILRKNPDY